MKHSAQFPFYCGLPDAPLAMPKQQLEQPRRTLIDALRGAISVFALR